MDSQNVIDISNNIDDLDNEIGKYMALTFTQKKRADEACLQKYGYTNTELYNHIKATLVKTTPVPTTPQNTDSTTVTEVSGINPYIGDTDPDAISTFDKISYSELLQDNDRNIIIINDFLSDDDPDYDINDLMQKYNRYLILPSNYRTFSNSYSIQIWNKTVPEMFNYMKSKIQTNDAEKSQLDNPDIIDTELLQYKEQMISAVKDGNFVEYSILKSDSMDDNDISVYESSVLQSLAEKVDYIDNSYDSDIPEVTPFFDPDEYTEYNKDGDIQPFDYIIIKDPRKYMDMISELMHKPMTKANESAIIKLGWNPYVPMNGVTLKYARGRQLNWLRIHEKCNLIDLRRFTSSNDSIVTEDFYGSTNMLEPIYIVLSYSSTVFGKLITTIKHCHYSHACLSLDSKLDHMYSFNAHPESDRYGLSIESLSDYNDKTGDADIMVMGLFVAPSIKKQIISKIQWYIDNKKSTSYSWSNLIKILLNKSDDSTYSTSMVCSQFVDAILKLCGINVTDKPSNLVAPSDFQKPSKGVNVYILYEGKKLKYDYKEINKKVRDLKKHTEFSKLNVYASKKVSGALHQYNMEAFNIDCKDDPKMRKLLEDLRDYIKPTSSIVEARTPIGFNKKGDMYIDLPKDLEAEYQEAHRLLSMYDETNLPGIKHELARLFYLNSIIEKKLKKMKKSDPDYKKLVDLRARILNDFTVYFKIVKAKEPDFDFMEYMKTTEYYNKTVEIDNSTLKFTGELIAKFLKLLKL